MSKHLNALTWSHLVKLHQIAQLFQLLRPQCSYPPWQALLPPSCKRSLHNNKPWMPVLKQACAFAHESECHLLTRSSMCLKQGSAWVRWVTRHAWHVWHPHALLAYYARHDKDNGVGADSLCSDGPVMLEGTKQMCLCTVNDWHIALSTIKGSQQAHLLQALWMRSNLTQWPWLHSCHC